MTAINIIRQRTQIHILSDGAAHHPDGTLAAIKPKVFAVEELNAAFAIRGVSEFAPFVLTAIAGAFRSFDQLIAGLEPTVRRASRHFHEISSDVLEFDLFVAGWSKSGAAESYLLANHDGHGDRCRPWQTVRLGDGAIAPEPSAEAFEAAGFQRPASVESFRPEIDGLSLLEAQRRTHCRMRSGAVISSAGGFAALTTIGAHRITSSILRRWPEDKIGGVIESPALGRVIERTACCSP